MSDSATILGIVNNMYIIRVNVCHLVRRSRGFGANLVRKAKGMMGRRVCYSNQIYAHEVVKQLFYFHYKNK